MNQNEIEEDEIDFERIIRNLKRNLKSIIVISFLITAIAISYAYFLQPIYSSSVSISFPNQQMFKLSSIIPGELTPLENKKSELETIKLTIKTRKFINSVIKDMNLSNRYYIEKNFKKIELYRFNNLEVNLTIIDKRLYGKYFKIEPFSHDKYKLTCDSLNYSEVHEYNKPTINKFFSINIHKKGKLPQQYTYFIKNTNKVLLADKILQNLTVKILSDNVLQIIYNDSVSKRAKELVNAIAKKFIAYSLEKKTNDITQTLIFLDKQIAKIKSKLENQGEELKGYQEKSNAFMPLESSRLLMDSISAKREALTKLTFQYTEVKKFKKALIRNQLNTVALFNSGINTTSIQNLVELFRKDTFMLKEMNLQSKNIGKSIIDNAQLTKLISQLNDKKRHLIDLEFNFTQGHPQVIQAKNEISLLEKEIHTYISTYIKKLKISKNLTKNKILNNIKMTQDSLKRKIEKSNKDIQEKEKKLRSLPEKDLRSQELKRKFILSEKVYTFLLEKKMDFKIKKASTIANTQIIEDAREGLKPIKPNKKLIVIIGFILGIILGILFTTIKIILDNKIRDISTVEELTNTPLYGTLPDKANKRFFNEALKNIYTNLYFLLPNEKKCITILISSTVANEGKTIVVANLSKTISNINKKVLVIDLNLRKPRLHKEFNKSNNIGVTDYLVGNRSIEDLIQPINDNLDFIASGAVPSNPAELLMSDKFNTFINKFKKEYDYILFDSAPIGTIIDALLILKYIDITLFIVRANLSEKSYLKNFNRLQVEKDIKSAGIILNQVKLNKNEDYGYGYSD